MRIRLNATIQHDGVTYRAAHMYDVDNGFAYHLILRAVASLLPTPGPVPFAEGQPCLPNNHGGRMSDAQGQVFADAYQTPGGSL